MELVKKIDNYFLFLILGIALYFGYRIFQPYLTIIVLGAVFASLFYPFYSWLSKKLKDRESLAAFITISIFVLIIIIPVANLIILMARESGSTLSFFEQRFVGSGQIGQAIDSFDSYIKSTFPGIDLSAFNLRNTLIEVGKSLNSLIFNATTALIKGTTQFVTSLFFLLITMYYFLKDGKMFLERIMYLTPLPNRYDQKIFDKFREVSKTTILSSMLTAAVQGVLASIAYYIVGLPVLFLAFATALASLIPVIGTAIVWVPVSIILLATGQYFYATFVMIWGVFVIGMSDNLIRTWFIKGQSNIHPLLVFFSIFGGIELFGFLGIIFGPLVLAIILTVIHIYELEYKKILGK